VTNITAQLPEYDLQFQCVTAAQDEEYGVDRGRRWSGWSIPLIVRGRLLRWQGMSKL